MILVKLQDEDLNHNPVNNVIWVPIEDVIANNYNPNSVAKTEMKLLYLSILKDGYTQPVVTVWDEAKGKYVIVDGFHRYAVMRQYKSIYESNHGLLPIVVLKHKTDADRKASTVRHNRARGKHSTEGMSSLVIELTRDGLTPTQVCNELGMEPDEYTRLMHVTGYARLYKNAEFSTATESLRQIEVRMSENDEDNRDTDECD